MSDRASALSIFAVLAVAVVGHVSLFPGVADLDGFYHIGHAQAYLEGSLFDTSLPWASRSIINDIGGDLWWGFHVLLLPFAAVFGITLGLQVAALALTAGLGSTVYWVLRRHGVEGAGWWAALFLVAVPNLFFRHLMVRPHVVSLAASIALLSVLVRGRWWQVALLTGLMSWVHLSLFWVAPGIAVAYAIARIPVTVGLGPESPDTGVPIRFALPSALLGTAAGCLLRPDAVDTLSLLNVQLVQLFAVKATDQPVSFAAELTPIAPLELIRTSWLFAVAWLVTGSLVVRAMLRGDLGRLGQAKVTLIVAAMAISTVFLGLALVSARRAMEQWVAFGFLAIPLLAPLLTRAKTPSNGAGEGLWRRVGAPGGVALALLVIHLVWGAGRHRLNVQEVAFPAATLQEVASFLEENSERGDLVFHTRWDNFGPLFAHNRTNRYLGGMDPIFQFAHDERSYWEFFYLSADATTEWTCDTWPCQEGVATDTHEALTEHFGARWVVVEPYRNPRFSLFLLNDPRFSLAFETPREAVFEVLEGGGP